MKIDLIVFPMHDWKKCEREGFRTRDAHLLLGFADDLRVNKILVVDRPTTLPEIIFKKISLRPRTSLEVTYSGVFSWLSQITSKIYVLDIFSLQMIRPIIMKRNWWGYIFNRIGIVNKVKKAAETVGIGKGSVKVLFLWTPFALGMIGKLDEKLFVFDALDNWERHPEIKDKYGFIQRGYENVKKKADIIFVNSKALQLFLNDSQKTKPVLIPNGVDENFSYSFSKELPDDLKKVHKPIVGYAGKLAKRIDTDLMIFLCRNLPQVNFVFIGQILDRNWIEPLFDLPNFYYLGDKHYNSLSEYINHFDICIIPHNVGDLENEGDPIKLYEYLVCGKPVVTTHIREVDRFRDFIWVAGGNKNFLDGINNYLSAINSGIIDGGRLRKSIKKSDLWSEKAKMMIDIICRIKS